MIKLITSATLALAMAVSVNVQAASSSSELSNNAKLAQPVKKNNDVERQLLINRYNLSGDSRVDYYNLVQSVTRDVGSNLQKKVNIVWRADYKKTAAKIKDELVKKGINPKKINLVKNQYNRAIYPISIEVEQYSAKPATRCGVLRGESVIRFPQNDCATKSNQRVQLKY